MSEQKSESSPANEFVKGFLWGFVAFVHVAAIMVVIYKMRLGCLPAKFVEALACTPPDSAKCAVACDPSNDVLFYMLAGSTAVALFVLPIAFGVAWVIRAREALITRI